MKNPVVKLMAEYLEQFGEFKDNHPFLFEEAPALYPIPFFGDIRRATALTLALNPARTEFDPDRHWLPGLDEYTLTTRLLHYFDLPLPEPHQWFKKFRHGLMVEHCSYDSNTAHIDLSPLPTKFRKELNAQQQIIFGRQIETQCESDLAKLLELAPKTRLILIVDYTFSQSDGSTATTSSFIRSNTRILNLLQAKKRRLKIWQSGGFVDF
jgi:hypothetical protein